MFTGIIGGIGKLTKVNALPGLSRLTISIDSGLLFDLQIGASIAINGACLTVVEFSKQTVSFDVIRETLDKTNLKFLNEGDLVNFERAARFGDEIGGHVLSGHIFGTAMIHAIEQSENNCIVSFKCPVSWSKYLIPKGYIALNGASLTLVDVDHTKGHFSVHLIPETLAKTTFSKKRVDDPINVEFDTQTQTIVDTIERLQHLLRL
jgi:riboflavin synthase